MKRWNKFNKGLIIALLIAAMLPNVSGADVTNHDITYDIGENSVIVSHKIEFSSILLGDEVLTIPRDVNSILLKSENNELEPEYNTGVLVLPRGYRSFDITYSTSEPLQASNKEKFFAITVDVLQKTESLDISAILPQKIALSTPVDEGTSVFPKPTTTTTDGQRITINWENTGLNEGDPISILLTYNDSRSFLMPIIGGLAGLVIIGFLLFKWKTKPEVEPKKEIKKDDKIFEEHLKEEERHIVNVLRKKEGKCQQSTLVLLTGYSKAHLSRLLQEMESRKLITKHLKGNKNIIILNEKLEELAEI